MVGKLCYNIHLVSLQFEGNLKKNCVTVLFLLCLV